MTSVQLDALQSAIEKLKSLPTLQQQNAILQQQVYEKDLELAALRSELQLKEDPKPYKEAIRKLNYLYLSTQASYEELSMVLSIQKYDEIYSHSAQLLKTISFLQKELSTRPVGDYSAKPSKSRLLFVSIFKRPLEVMLACMTGTDILNLVKAYPFLAHELMSKHEVLEKLESCFGQIESEKQEVPRIEMNESEEIKSLLEKYNIFRQTSSRGV